MREFEDGTGMVWSASVREWPGDDYKGRFELLFRPGAGSDDAGLALTDVRWNSRGTAERTLRSMSRVELCRRLRSARGRSGPRSLPDSAAGESVG